MAEAMHPRPRGTLGAGRGGRPPGARLSAHACSRSVKPLALLFADHSPMPSKLSVLALKASSRNTAPNRPSRSVVLGNLT